MFKNTRPYLSCNPQDPLMTPPKLFDGGTAVTIAPWTKIFLIQPRNPMTPSDASPP